MVHKRMSFKVFVFGYKFKLKAEPNLSVGTLIQLSVLQRRGLFPNKETGCGIQDINGVMLTQQDLTLQLSAQCPGPACPACPALIKMGTFSPR